MSAITEAQAGLGLVEPCLERLPAYVAALKTGWSPNTIRDVSAEELAAIAADAPLFLARLRGEAPGIARLPDGTEVPRLPGKVFWMWDGDFCGSINFRHQPGTEALPPHVSGHAGYAVVPWKQSHGYATRALGLLLPIACRLGLPRLLLTCDEGNSASRRAIEANGGVLADRVEADGTAKLRFWVNTQPRPVGGNPLTSI